MDNLNMEVSYIISDIKNGCTPQVHYGSGPYIYTVGKYDDKWAIFSILDMDDSSEPSYSILALLALVFVWIKKVAKRRENLRPKY